MYDNWTSNDARNSDFVVGVLAPGKEAKSNWSHKRYDTGEYDCNHNDVLPVILLGHEVFDKPLTFEEIFDALAKLADVDKSTAFILRHILLRMAFCVDHKVLENGNVRWEPPLEIMQIIYEKIPEIKEVFSILPHDKDIFIEVKTKEVIVPYLLQEIESQKAALNQITVISFYPEVIRRIKERNANIKCNLLVAFDYENIKTSKIEEIILSIGADGLGAQNHKRFNNELSFIRAIN
mgnify:CR=1 FL=1